MSRKQDVDWSDWKGHVEKQVSPLSRDLPSNLKKGSDLFKSINFGNLPVIQDAPRQPTNEEMFGHLVVSAEEITKKEENWKNRMQKTANALYQPIDHLNKSAVSDKSWGTGKSFNSMLSEEELKERNKFAKE